MTEDDKEALGGAWRRLRAWKWNQFVERKMRDITPVQQLRNVHRLYANSNRNCPHRARVLKAMAEDAAVFKRLTGRDIFQTHGDLLPKALHNRGLRSLQNYHWFIRQAIALAERDAAEAELRRKAIVVLAGDRVFIPAFASRRGWVPPSGGEGPRAA